MHRNDPMDRMLIAAALDRGLTVITEDEIFNRYGVSTLWQVKCPPITDEPHSEPLLHNLRKTTAPRDEDTFYSA